MVGTWNSHWTFVLQFLSLGLKPPSDWTRGTSRPLVLLVSRGRPRWTSARSPWRPTPCPDAAPLSAPWRFMRRSRGLCADSAEISYKTWLKISYIVTQLPFFYRVQFWSWTVPPASRDVMDCPTVRLSGASRLRCDRHGHARPHLFGGCEMQRRRSMD